MENALQSEALGAGAREGIDRPPSGVSIDTGAGKKIYPWKVVHACEQVRDILPVVECQLAVGMRPFLVTPRGFGSGVSYLRRPFKERVQPVSLLQAWGHVRNWKRLLTESDPAHTAQILHAHSFPAGMAAVRSDAAVVYELNRTVEEIAPESGTWLGRSFRVAEQFVLTRAGAVVVHTQRLYRQCVQRGVPEAGVFVAPFPVDPNWLDSEPDRRWIEARTGANSETTIFFVPSLGEPGPEQEKTLSVLLAGFEILHRENTNIRLICPAGENTQALLSHAHAFKLQNVVCVWAPDDRERVFASCDIAIVFTDPGWRPAGPEARPSSDVVEALARGRAVLAADIAATGEALPAYAGLRFAGGSERQLAATAAFLARNPGLCRVTAAKGRGYIARTHSLEAVGALYDEIYKTVIASRKQRNVKPPEPQLVPLQIAL